MSGALFDTSVLMDYLAGEKRAQRALAPFADRSISVVTWLELMMLCPPPALEPTRGFLRTFERLSLSESIADEALRLRDAKPGLSLNRSVAWASATVNQLDFVTVDPAHIGKTDRSVVMPYRWPMAARAPAARSGQPGTSLPR